MTLSLDIIIPTYNRPLLPQPLIAHLLPQCRGEDRILVVWQGTMPAAENQSLQPQVRHLMLARPNLPAARNSGLKASQADIVLFLDDDIVPTADLIFQHRTCYNDPQVDGVAGYVDDPLFDRSRPQPSFIDLSTGDCVQNFSCPVSGKTASAMGANMSFRRAALSEAGGFDERFKHNALWEEIDCCLRLLAKGHSLRYCADAKVSHLREGRGGCREDRGRYHYLYHQFANTAYFASRFARPEHYGQWFTFWKYRLEYLARKPGGRSHDLLSVLAAAAGAAGGIARFWGSLLFQNLGPDTVDRTTLAKNLAALGSKG